MVFLSALITPYQNEWAESISSVLNGGTWVLDNSSLIKNITNYGLKQELQSAISQTDMEFIEKKIFYINMARVLLISLFVFICYLVYLSHQKRLKEGRKNYE